MAMRDQVNDAWGDTTQQAQEVARPPIREAHLQGLNVGLPEAGLDPQVEPDPRSLRFAQRHNARAVRRVSQDMREEIVNGVQTALREGRRQEAVEQAIQDAFDGEAWRVPVIGRTELNRAHNWGRLAAWRKSQVVAGKEWITAGDDRVRASHAAIHGERVPKGQTFSLGVLAPPGDANCRCTMAPITRLSGFQDDPHTPTGSIHGLATLDRRMTRSVLSVLRQGAERVKARLREQSPAAPRAPRRVVA